MADDQRRAGDGATAGDDLVPTVDLSGWDDGDTTTRQAIADRFDHACEAVGFLQLTGHGLPDAVTAGLREAADALFALPLDAKLALRPPRPLVNRGYAAKGSESLAYSLGETRPPDLFEAFNVGVDRQGADDPDFFPANLWPDALPAFRPAVEAYLAAALALAHRLESVAELALGLEPGFFRARTDHGIDVLRMNRYERAAGEPPPTEAQMRMGAHTDYGIVTILLADPVPGLQIVGPEGGWHDVVPAPGALLINLGDALAVWTNDRWRSTLHRVVPPTPGIDGPALRRSFAFFHDGNVDARIECLPSCLGPGEAARYAPLTIGEHLAEKVVSARAGTAARGTQTAATRLPV